MDWGPPSFLPESRLLLLQLLTLLLVMGGGRCEGCQVENCTSQYGGHQHLQDFQATPELCRLAYAYLRCLRDTARSCRGDINFHFVYSWLEKKITQNDCAALLRTTESSKAAWTPPPSTSAAPPPSPPPHCVWRGRQRYRHCGLFGDPHLKTFDNEYQTCRVRGAWPLIDNPYLAVQVTNEPVIEGSPATATTKVTVIVRGKNTTCTPEKTYEAQSDSPLPAVFIDGTRQSGPDQTVLLTTHDGGARVEISALHIASRVIVRRSGHYLALAAQVPEELALSSPPQGAAAAGLQLCARGCPASERLDTSGAAAQDAAAAALPWEAAVARCRRSPTLNLSFPYLDWCVFDVMTTAADEFVAAARSAQDDVMRLDPGSLNGTAPGFEPGATAVAASPAGHWCLTLALLAALFAGS